MLHDGPAELRSPTDQTSTKYRHYEEHHRSESRCPFQILGACPRFLFDSRRRCWSHSEKRIALHRNHKFQLRATRSGFANPFGTTSKKGDYSEQLAVAKRVVCLRGGLLHQEAVCEVDSNWCYSGQGLAHGDRRPHLAWHHQNPGRIASPQMIDVSMTAGASLLCFAVWPRNPLPNA
jgi:hypothetical protein